MAFWDCPGLGAINVDALNSFYSSVDGVLFNKSQTTLIQCPGGKAGSFTITSSVTNIESDAFTRCTSLTWITVDSLNPVYSSLDGALFNKSQTTLIKCPGGKPGSYTVPNGVTNIQYSAFGPCTSLTAIGVEALNSFYSSADGVLFDKNQTRLIQCPGGKAGNYTVPNSVTIIGTYAFYSCSGLTDVAIGSSVTSIPYAAFGYCSSLTNVALGNNVTTIENFAFYSCSGLTDVTLGSNVTRIGSVAFSRCNGLTNINVNTLNSAYSSRDGVLFDKGQTMLIQYPGGKTGSYTIPTGVLNIGSDAFSYSESLTAVTIPNSANNISPNAFFVCGSLSNVTISSSVAYIPDRGFAYCSNLAGVFFRGNLPSASSTAFSAHPKATVYYLPGATGWGTTFAGRPTALWNPVTQTTAPNFGVRTNRFCFNITGTPNIPVEVEARADLASGPWVPLRSFSLTNGLVYFSDPDWTNHPARLYRLRSP